MSLVHKVLARIRIAVLKAGARPAVPSDGTAHRRLRPAGLVTLCLAAGLLIGLPASVSANIRLVAAPPGGRVLYVVAVGVNDYRAPSLPRLHLAVPDALSVSDALEKHGGGVFTSVRKTVLVDDQATRDRMQAAFDSVSASAHPDDVFVFYFSGHGGSLSSSPREPGETYLMPADVTQFNGKKPPIQAVSATLLKAWCAKVPARQQLIVIDAALSQETFTIFARRATEEGASLPALTGRSVTIIGPELGIEDPQLGHGVFAAALLQGLEGEAKVPGSGSDLITVRDLTAYLPRKVLELSPANRMHCYTYEQGSDFPIAGVREKSRPSSAGRDGGFSKGVQVVTLPEEKAPTPRSGKDYALLLAACQYDDPKFTTLANPISDAQIIASTLEAKYGYEHPEIVTNPTYSDMFDVLTRYQKPGRFQEEDQLLIFFAGHGLYHSAVGDGFLAAKDSRADSKPGGGNLFQFSNLRWMVNNIPCKHIFLVIDACFSGAFDIRVAQALGRAGPDLDLRKSEAEYVHAKMKYVTRLFLTSGRLESVSDGNPGAHSPFTLELLNMLRDHADRGHLLTFTDIVAQMKEAKPERCWGPFGSDEAGTDFVFLPK